MQIVDDRGRSLEEATVHLSDDEIADLLVAASQLDDRSRGHEVIRDPSGTSLALYRLTEDETPPLARHTDWWVGPVILFLVVLAAVGAFTVVRGLVNLIF